MVCTVLPAMCVTSCSMQKLGPIIMIDSQFVEWSLQLYFLPCVHVKAGYVYLYVHVITQRQSCVNINIINLVISQLIMYYVSLLAC